MSVFKALCGALAGLMLVAGCGDDAPASDGGVRPDGGVPDGGGRDAALPDDWLACNAPSDCVVVPATCCGNCGAPARGNALAIARDKQAEHTAAVCEEDQACPDCDYLFLDPTLVATCRDARCELVDLLEHEASACESDDECAVRTPDCCPCGGDTSPGRLIGVSSTMQYEALVCDPEQGCDDCLPSYPSEVTASCNADGHCETEDPRVDPSYVPDAGSERPPLCALPKAAGPCFALVPSYYYDTQADSCLYFEYGGCEGNDNRFETLDACAETCQPGNEPGVACEVDGVIYPSGASGVDDPVSCNTCQCIDGALTACTEIACQEPCEEGTAFGMECAQCGPADGCEVVRFGCLPACEDLADCTGGGQCVSGVCRNLCG